ncbi:MAG: ATP-binding protein [Lachnospiraceae bacterium]|nr:ATP-binding protein [Lachnospiraceae bacterium]
MGLSNVQYDEIMRMYERRRDDNRHRLEKRRIHVYENISSFKELDSDIASLSVIQAKKYLSGDENAITLSKTLLTEKIKAKEELLLNAGFTLDYLNPNYECPDCEDTGYTGQQKCHCLRQAIIDLLYDQSGIKEMLKKENFSQLDFSYHQGEDLTRFKNSVEICQTFCENFDYRNFFFYGTVGTGKSFLSGCVAKALIDKGLSVIYYTATEFFATISRFTFDYNTKDELYTLREDLANCDLLIIDDLGTELANNFTIPQLFTYINTRHLNQKATIISTNLSLEEFKMLYSDRIFSRIYSKYEFLYFSGPDIRIMKKRKAKMEGK